MSEERKEGTLSIASVKVGDELFRYVDGGGVFRYMVIGRREYEKDVQLEVECKTCSHGWQCQLLLAQNDYGKVIAVSMLNNDDDDDQRHWHGNEGFHFWLTVDEVKAEKLAKMIREAQERVSKAKDALHAAELRLKELKGIDQGVQP